MFYKDELHLLSLSATAPNRYFGKRWEPLSTLISTGVCLLRYEQMWRCVSYDPRRFSHKKCPGVEPQQRSSISYCVELFHCSLCQSSFFANRGVCSDRYGTQLNLTSMLRRTVGTLKTVLNLSIKTGNGTRTFWRTCQIWPKDFPWGDFTYEGILQKWYTFASHMFRLDTWVMWSVQLNRKSQFLTRKHIMQNKPKKANLILVNNAGWKLTSRQARFCENYGWCASHRLLETYANHIWALSK